MEREKSRRRAALTGNGSTLSAEDDGWMRQTVKTIVSMILTQFVLITESGK